MSDYVAQLMAQVKAKNPAEPEFHQAVQEVAESVQLVYERHPEYRKANILELGFWEVPSIITQKIWVLSGMVRPVTSWISLIPTLWIQPGLKIGGYGMG